MWFQSIKWKPNWKPMQPKAILFKGKTRKKDNTHPIMINISGDGKRKRIAFKPGIWLKESEWDTQNNTLKKKMPTNPDYKTYLNLRSTISDKISEYDSMIKELESDGREVTIDQLIEMVENPIKRGKTVFEYWEGHIASIKKSGHIGNSRVYTGALSMLKRYVKEVDFKFYEIDKGFLLGYRDFMSEKGYKPNYISLNIRTFQALYNHAKDHGYVKGESPFENKAILKGIRKNRTPKRAISMEEVERIFNLEYEPGTRLFNSQNYFIFGFLGDGINFVDMAFLKWTNIVDGEIEYVRHKKKSTKPETTRFPITPEISRILSHYKPLTGIDPENYIFPIFHKHLHITPQQLENRRAKILSQLNDDLKIIGVKAKIRTPLTTYVWRHSLATQLISDGASLEDVRMKMDHESIGTTETYIKDLQRKKRNKYSTNLSDRLSQSKKASS